LVDVDVKVDPQSKKKLIRKLRMKKNIGCIIFIAPLFSNAVEVNETTF